MASGPILTGVRVIEALIVVDMQVGLLSGPACHDLPGVIARINRLAADMRARGGHVIWIQHHSATDDDFRTGSPGWHRIPELDHRAADITVGKTLNDAFADSDLSATLERLDARTLLIAGWATDYCVDATIRSAVSRHYPVVVTSDAHTVSDRPHLSARTVIDYHNWLWAGLIARPPVRIVPTDEWLRG